MATPNVTRQSGGIVRFSQEAWQELSKVTWPTRETVIRFTVLVILISGGIAALAMDADGRRQALDSLRAPSFGLDDLDGNPHRLEQWRGQKKLLVAFASW